MAFGSVLFTVLIWSSLQFGIQFGLMSPIDIQALRIPISLQAYETYFGGQYKEFHHEIYIDVPVNEGTYNNGNIFITGFPYLSQQRSQRSFQKKFSKLPHIDDHSIDESVKFSELNLGRETRMENTLIWSNTRVRQETPQHGQLIESCPTAEALKHGRDALIANKASLYISHRHCQT